MATLPDQICIFRRQTDTGEVRSWKEARVEAGRHGQVGGMGLPGGARLGFCERPRVSENISMSVRCVGAQKGPLQVFTRDSVTCLPDNP